MNSIQTWQSTWSVYVPMSCICLLMCIYEYTLIVFLYSNTFIHFMQIQDMHGGDICCYSWLHSWDHWSLSWLEFLVLLLSVLSFIVIFIKVLQACPPWRNFPWVSRIVGRKVAGEHTVSFCDCDQWMPVCASSIVWIQVLSYRRALDWWWSYPSSHLKHSVGV